MKVLVVGSGGREHALAWKIRKSPHVSWVGVAPGNGGTDSVAENVDIAANDLEGIARYAKDNAVNLTVIGPEAPLAEGITELFDQKDNLVFGPSKSAALIESDKRFAKDLMDVAGVPTAPYRCFNDARIARAYVSNQNRPLVVKASGLAAGKGVFICTDQKEAVDAINKIMENKVFGTAGNEIIVEECLQGQEVSLQVITDGTDYLVLPPAQDHKRIGEGDTGENTGGMGAYAPAGIITNEMIRECGAKIIEPVLKTLKDAGTPYKGLLYAGLMITDNGPQVLEFNCRFGDPETQVVLPVLGVDLVDLMLVSIAEKQGMMMESLKLNSWDWDTVSNKHHASTVILAANGYPASYPKGMEITNIPSERNEMIVFHAGTKKENDRLLCSGGRVMAVTGLGKTLKEALFTAYTAAEDIKFEHKYFRKDIAYKAMQNL